MSKIICPYCFEQFNSSEVMFRCSNLTGCKKTSDANLKKFWGTEHFETPCFKGPWRLFGGAPDSAKCPECGSETFWVACPHCHNRLPKQMVKTKGCIISIIGARSSGKTVYITTLINELMRHGYTLGNIGVVASNVANKPENNTQTRYERDFFNILYKNAQCPPQTMITDSRSKVPLIYELSQKGKQPLYLVIYDTAGENFVDPNNIAANVKFLEHSDACIYVLDTFAIPAVHERLQGKLGLEPIELRFDTILSNVINYFENGNRKIFEKPLALVFSKIDAILTNKDMFMDTDLAGMRMEQNSSFLDGTGVDLSDMSSISDSIQGALVENWGESNFVANINNHYDDKRVHYFGISALGDMPDRNKNIHNLRPYRVLDPLVWILSQFNYSLPKAR